MKRLENLNEIANQTLGGLHAGTPLKQKILEKTTIAKKPRPFYLQPAFGAALSLCVVILGVYALLPKATPDETTIHSIAAGGGETQTRAMLNLAPGSVQLFSADTSSHPSLWADGQGADFPLIAAFGKYYRLMESPPAIHESLLGEALGDIQEFTSEPSLSTTDTLVSNIAAQGETVYALSGMNGAAVAANVNGALRVFQRVSYAGNALKGGESLADTLKASGKVIALELSGYEPITDSETAAALVNTLLNNASYENASLLSSDSRLLIQLDSGISLQLMVKDDTVSACGSWSCPEFFEAFSK